MQTDPTRDALATIHEYGSGRALPEQSPAMLAGLSADDLDVLRQSGILNAVSNRDLAEDETLRPGFGIIYDDDKFGELIGIKPPFDWFEAFLRRCHLAWYNAANDSLTLVSTASLHSLLPRYVGHFLPLTPIDIKDDENEHADSIRTFTNFCATHWICDFEFDGMVCAEPMCAAEHCWIQNGHCYAYVHSGSAITSFRIYPFATAADTGTGR